MVNQLTWIGLKVSDCVISEQLADGPFSSVYSGMHTNQKKMSAFKVSKPYQLIDEEPIENPMLTQAKVIWSGVTQDARPQSDKLLSIQAEKLKSTSAPGLVAFEELVTEPNSCYLKMELIEGNSLRQMLGFGGMPIAVLIETAKIMQRITSHYPGWSHGDLKPDNIMYGPKGVTLIDPGYFGQLDFVDKDALYCAVTTPSYYPLLEPDDLYSFGVMLWETSTKNHPLFPNETNADTQPLGPELEEFVANSESLDRFFLSPIRKLNRPSYYQPNMPANLEEVVLKSMRLKLANNCLERADGFASFEEFGLVLEELKKQGIEWI